MFHVLADRCSHAAGSLSEGQVTDGCVTCPWHGSVFRLSDGWNIDGPATGRHAAPRPSIRQLPKVRMDATVLLKDDHKTVEKLFKEFEKAGDGAYRSPRRAYAVVRCTGSAKRCSFRCSPIRVGCGSL